MKEQRKDQIRQSVRETYSKIALKQSCGCCGGNAAGDDLKPFSIENVSRMLGYSQAEIQSVPQAANLGLGCGNPQAIAELKPGETVLDLGSGGGFDCFLAAKTVGPKGRVIGVDMTPEMISTARQNAAKFDAANVEFRLGEIENLPVADNSVDVIISNCVVNLSPEKPAVIRDAFRALKPGGRLAISDIVATQPLPAQVREDLALVSGCVGGAAEIADLEKMLRDAGFRDIQIQPQEESRQSIRDWFPEHSIDAYIVSASIKATKPD